MKQLALILAMSFFAMIGFSQGLFEKLTEEYADLDGFSASNINNDMFEMYLKKKDIGKESPVYATLDKLDHILLVSLRDFDKKEKEPNVASLHTELLNHYKSSAYTLFKTEKQMGEDVKVYLKKKGEDITSLALVTSSEMSVHLVELDGIIDINNLAQLGRAMNLKGLENIYRVSSNSSNQYFSGGWFSHPFDFEGIDGLSDDYKKKLEETLGGKKLMNDEQLQELVLHAKKIAEQHRNMDEEKIRQMEAKARELAEQQHILSEEQIKRIEEQAREMAERHLRMNEKYREMAQKYKREPIFLSAPGDTNTVYFVDGKEVKAKEFKELDKDAIRSIEIDKGKNEGDKTVIKVKTK